MNADFKSKTKTKEAKSPKENQKRKAKSLPKETAISLARTT